MEHWEKLGRLYSPGGGARHPHLLTHAANPLPVHIKDDVYRIYFSGRDEKNRSSVGAVDIDIVKRTVVQEYEGPFFSFGPAGSFYADGVSIGNCYEANGITYMLFMGWQRPKGAHWRGDIGRLKVESDLSLSLDRAEPLMGVNSVDPVSLSYPWVMWNDVKKCYEMWYGSTKTWDTGSGEMLHVLNYAVSKDGHSWQREGLAVPYIEGLAQAFSRPTVLKLRNMYAMWFSYRGYPGRTYRIGHAVSDDGSSWELALDARKIDVSADGWDSEMIEYPYVFQHKGAIYMLYNGNGFGKTGFGLAVLRD
ncbi:hypothetical protein DB346_04385 [Verrucomicrobia bacterium LW23]|nr:hypothetical protein DB346_04385 [Verrucomicrobia bacterium LW23]